MKYVIFIHSNPQPWGHPTSDHTREYQELSPHKQSELGANWDKVIADADSQGEIVYSAALADPREANILRYQNAMVTTQGPYTDSKEHLAGFFVVDVETKERAEEIASAFACPGDTVELRATMTPAG